MKPGPGPARGPDKGGFGRPETAGARARRVALFAPARDLAVRGLLRWKSRSLLLVLLIGLAVTSYLTTSVFATGTRAQAVPEISLGMDRAILVRLRCDDGTGFSWAYVQTRFLDDPRVVEYPRFERRYRSLVTDEEGGELAMLRANPQVDAAWVARLLTLQFPWGTDDLLSLPPAASALASLTFAAGRAPSGPAEIALPEGLAAVAGLGPGDAVEVLVTDPDSRTRGAFSTADLTVSGVFRGGPAHLQRPLGWLEASYDVPWITMASAHWPRVLENLEPNAYLIEIAPGASVESFLLWFTDGEWIEDQLYLHLHPRYPAAQIWSDFSVADSLSLGAEAGMSAFAGILLLSLAFVAVGVFTIFILSFLERRREIAILKTVGLTGGNIATIFWMEAGSVALLGLLLGTGGAAAVLRVWFGAGLSLAMAIRAAVVTGAVTVASCLLPVAMARVATVSELLGGQRVTAVFRHRVGEIEGGALAGHASRGIKAR